jgi:hypothetical protein
VTPHCCKRTAASQAERRLLCRHWRPACSTCSSDRWQWCPSALELTHYSSSIFLASRRHQDVPQLHFAYRPCITCCQQLIKRHSSQHFMQLLRTGMIFRLMDSRLQAQSAPTHLRFFADSSSACCNAVPPCCCRSADRLRAGRSAAWGGVSGCRTSAEGDEKAEGFALCGHCGGSTISTPASTSGVTCTVMRSCVKARSHPCAHASDMLVKKRSSVMSIDWCRMHCSAFSSRTQQTSPAAHQ